jgi:Domain of unknown function (DUF4328)
MEAVVAPEVAQTTFPPPPPPPPPTWRNLVGLGHAVVALVVASVTTAVAVAVTTIVAASEIDDADGSSALGPFRDAMDAFGAHAQVLLLYVVLYLATGVTFIAWLYRAVQNDRALGRSARHSPGWAIGGWFIPFANFVIPYQVVADLWRGRGRRRTTLTWWLAWIVGAGLLWWVPVWTLGQIQIGSTTSAGRADLVVFAQENGHGSPVVGMTLAGVVFGLAGILLVRLVRGIASFQQREAEAFGVVAPVASRTRRWWAGLPLAVAALLGLLVVPLWGHTNSTGEDVSATGELFEDPEGQYVMRIDPTWERLTGTPTGQEAFGVSAPGEGGQASVLLVSGNDATISASAFANELAAGLPPGFTVVARGSVADSAGALDYLETRAPDGTHGYAVVAVTGDVWVLAEFAAPPGTYEDLLSEVTEYLHTLEPTV